jgi:hypothetical protein
MWLLALIAVAPISFVLIRPGESRRHVASAMSPRAGRAGERRASRAPRSAPDLAFVDDFVFAHHRVTAGAATSSRRSWRHTDHAVRIRQRSTH